MDIEGSHGEPSGQLWDWSFYDPSSTTNQLRNTSVNTDLNNCRRNINPAPYNNQLRESYTNTNTTSDRPLPFAPAPCDNYRLQSSSNTRPFVESVPRGEFRRRLAVTQAGGGGHEAVSLPSMMQELSAKMEMVSQLLSAIMAGDPAQDLLIQDNANAPLHYSSSFSHPVPTTNVPAIISTYTDPNQTFSAIGNNLPHHSPPLNMFANNYAGVLPDSSLNTNTQEHPPSAYSYRDNRFRTGLIINGNGVSVNYQSTSSTDSSQTYTGDIGWHDSGSSISNGSDSLSTTPFGPSLDRISTSLSPRMRSRATKPSAHSRISQPVHQTSMFCGSSNVEVIDSVIAINNNMSPDAGFIILSQVASKEAVRDSQERCPPPRCHPKTRTKVIDDFFVWIKTLRPSKVVCWLHSPFGHGKSAVMQTIMDRMVAEGLRHLFAGGFFFGRGKPGRDKAIYLFATIAYQIAMFIPGMREHINNAMLTDPTLPSKSIEIQLHSLIVDPLFKCAEGPHFRHSPTVFIDGLDECDTTNDQVAVLDLVAATLHDHNIPLRFIIASRPEAHIRDCFDRSPLNAISERVDLPDDDDEMTAYVRTKFDEIYDNRLRTMQLAGIQKPWPSQEVIDGLVRRASGQYVFVDTVLRFVGANRLNPGTQLKIVLTRLSDASVFTDMDSIYRLILEQCPDIYRHILTIIIDNLIYYESACPNGTAIADIWQLPLADVHLVVESLAAVIVELDRHMRVHHLSFREFLEDESRSGIFFRNKDLVLATIRAREVTVFKSVLTRDYFGLMEEINPSELLQLVCRSQSREFPMGKDLEQWYYMVHLVMKDILNHSGIFPTGEKWSVADNIDIEVIQELFNCCLGIWKDIANRAFAVMDSRLVNAILESRPLDDFTVPELARVAGMDKEECLCVFEQHKVLFGGASPYFDLLGRSLSVTQRIFFRDYIYYRLDEDSTWQCIRDNRKDFYRNLG